LIDFRPVEGEEGHWEVWIYDNELGWIHAGEASANYAGDVVVSGDNGEGMGWFSCRPGGGWTWTVTYGGKKWGGTMS
jgi:hypothetical protein